VAQVGCDSLSQITPEVVQLFLLKVRENAKPITVRDYFNNIKNWLSWLESNDYLERNPMAKMKKPKVEKHVIKPFSNEQITTLLMLCDDSFNGIRNATIILTFLDTGLRLSEMASIRMSDIDGGRGLIKVMGKGSKERHVAIGKTTMNALARYIVARAKRCHKYNRYPETLWITEECRPVSSNAISLMIRRLGKRAEISGVRCSPHTFRHTAAISCLRNGMGEFNLQFMLGHSDLKMTRKYLGTLGEDELIAAHRTASPVDKMFK